MNNFIKMLILVAVLLYVISPIDAVPGPIDDVIVTLLGLAARKHLSAAE
jgi:uncharacterized membrane protein YkvA (DUF1232 family)